MEREKELGVIGMIGMSILVVGKMMYVMEME
jgi:hypothetical protein